MKLANLPSEILTHINQQLITAGESNPATAQTPTVQQHAPLPKKLAVRQAAKHRANFASTSRRLRDVDRDNLSRKENADVGCMVTQNAIPGLIRDSARASLMERFQALFGGHSNIGVDFRDVSPEQARVVLAVLKQRGRTLRRPHCTTSDSWFLWTVHRQI